jgi:hypothetical protein
MALFLRSEQDFFNGFQKFRLEYLIFSRLAASSAASLTTLAMSAPENPGVRWATSRKLTSAASGFLRQ